MNTKKEAIWYNEKFGKCKFKEFPALVGDLKTDVLIIGGGAAGILTAYFLKERGVDCILLEKDRLCSGVTGCSSAKITAGHRLIYSRLLKNEGLETAQKYYSANSEALEKYKNLCKNIDCDFEIKDNYVYSRDSADQLEKELCALDKIGAPVDLVQDIPLPFKTAGALRLRNQAQFDPLEFFHAIAADLNIFENTFVREIVGNTALTDHGKIAADKIIIATHFPIINKHGLYFLKMYQHRSYMLALENAADVKGMYIDTKDDGLSFRNYKNLLLLGGKGNHTGKPCGGWDELRSLAKIYYPESKEICSWATQDCITLDGMPYIGRYSPRTDNMYVATGFNKWGMTSSMVAAGILCDLICGKKNDYSDIFDPSRSILKPQLLKNVGTALSGIINFKTKRCPHLGCALKWNSAEHTWDCPCHGSRFTKDGKLLNNPANSSLDRD